MRVLNAINAGLRSRLCRGAINLYLCAMVSLFLTACMDDITLPEFPSLKQSETRSAAAQDGGFMPVKKIKTETLLDEKGNWNLVEKSEAVDPMQAHLAARKQVNTKRRKTDKKLSAHFKPDAKSGEDGKMRVLRLEPGDHALEDYEVAESSIAKPSHAVAEGDLLNKIKKLYGENDESSRGFVVPKRKPALMNTALVVSTRPKSSDERIVNGYIIPPAIPTRKLERKAVIRDVPVKVKPQTAMANNGIVIPKRKPIMSASAARLKAQNSVRGATDNQTTAGSSNAIRMRSGKHPGKTRLVIEVTKTTKYKVALDHVRNTLRIKLYDTNWNLSPQNSFTLSKLLGTYVARKQKDGSVLLEIRLKKKTKILDTLILRPNISSKHRVVIDLKD